MLDEQDGLPVRLQLEQLREHLGGLGLVHAGGGLVEHEQLRLQGQRPGDLGAAPVGVAERVRRVVAARPESRLEAVDLRLDDRVDLRCCSRREAGVPTIAMNSSPSSGIQRSRNTFDSLRNGRFACRVEWSPTSMLSATDRVANTRPFWNVRAMPCSAMRALSARSMRSPSSVIVPPFGRIVPVTRLSVVVLPDPLGPMIDTTSPRRDGERDPVDGLEPVEVALEVLAPAAARRS